MFVVVYDMGINPWSGGMKMESLMGSFGYASGAFFALVIVGIILYVFKIIIGGIKWALIFAAIWQ